MRAKHFVPQQQQNLGRNLTLSKIHLSPPPNPPVAQDAVRSKAVALLLLLFIWWWLHPLWDSLIVLCFVVRYFLSILLLQLYWWGRQSWLLSLVCLPGVSWLVCGSSWWCHGNVCSFWPPDMTQTDLLCYRA